MTTKELAVKLRARIAVAANAPSTAPGTAWIIGAFFTFSALAMIYKPNGFWRYFTGESPIFDIAHYHNIAKEAYNPVTAAFYPLWPLIIRMVSSVVPDDKIIISSSLLAAALFFLSIPILLKSFRGIMPRSLAFILVACFAFNPNSLFHVLSYPESIATLLSALILFSATRYLLEGKGSQLYLIFTYFALLSFSRPVLAQVMGSGSVALLICRLHGQKILRRELSFTLTAIVGATIGYLPYGLYCLQSLGNFFAPFAAQSAWDRKLGLYWSLIFSPKAVSNSDVVLLWDLQAFYGPALIFVALIFAAVRRCKPSPKIREPSGHPDQRLAYLGWFSVLFAGSHSAIAFLTHPIFLSTARHVFAIPFIFYALGYAVADRWDVKSYRRGLIFYVFFSAIYLMSWWGRYARAGWIG